ncbi:MAG TPA: TlpA disulfide reductase family protein [Chitinophaga sp.]|uniref:TlpA family protein disulfide reductase n=1 Tax=Chitinophaga sp. TaxID=1869181 RepID=UPI002CB1EF47|nr:TlpA disulfide reductase family protein [Chitinophaga sp.]HVI44838.1 TlpA disulfide reductase family protein [Chitinophaga sp.]
MKPTKFYRLLPVLAAMALSPRVYAGPVPTSPLSVIQGKTGNDKATKITLFKVTEGRKTEIATAFVNEQHAFAFALPSPKEGFYYLSDGGRDGDTRIYLKSGDQLQLSLDGSNYKVVAGSPENKALQLWHDQLSVLSKHTDLGDTATFYSFFPQLEAFVPRVPVLKQQVNTPNKKFNDLLKYTMDVDLEYAALRFLLIPHSVHPDRAQYPAYYRQVIKDSKYCDTRLLQNANGTNMIQLYATFHMIMGDKEKLPKGAERLSSLVSLFCNDTIKGVVITENLRSYRSFESLREAVVPVEKYLLTDVQKQSYFDYEKSVRKFAAGEPGFNFSGEDTNGKKVAFNDLKGKVVVVDVWATWCGPCKAELPHLQKLEEEMAGKNVTFLGVSVDEAKDKEKWQNFVKEKEMKGTQIFVSGWSEIAKYYGINGIPRFMVFDQKGNIVNVDAPRPSQPELKELINKLL